MHALLMLSSVLPLAALALIKKGYEVVLACRDGAKAADAQQKLM